MAKKTINFDNVTVKGGQWNGVDKISIDSASVEGLKADGKNLTIADVGTFTTTSDSVVSFVADAGATDVSIVSGAKASVKSLNFSKTTDGFKYALDTDDDVITFGAGKDTLTANAGTAKGVTLNGFDATNDLINTTVTSASSLALTNTGVLQGTGIDSLSFTTNGADLYQARVSVGGGVKQYWTTAQRSTVSKIDASSLNEQLILDAMTASDADITLGKAGSSVSMNAGKVASGAGDDTIKATGALTLSIGKNDGTDTITSSIGASDTVVFEGGRLSQISIDGSNASLSFGKTGLLGLDKTAGTSMFSAQFGTDATAGKLQWGDSITAATDTVYFYGTAANSTVTAADKATVNYDLSDSTKFQNIHYVSLQAATAATISLSNGGTGDTVDATKTTVAAAITLGDGADVVSLKSDNNVRDTIATKAVSGKSTVSGFKNGFETDSDVLKLTDITSATLLDIGSNASIVSFDKDKEKTSSIQFNGINSGTDGLLIQFSGSDTASKVAADLNNDGSIKTALADFYVGAKNGNTLLSISGAAADATNGTALDFSDATKFVNLSKFDLSGLKGQQVVIGTAGADKITVGSGTDAAAVWGGGASADDISLKSGATTHVWFSASDGNDKVTGFTTDDDIFFWGASSLSDIATGYTFAKDGNNVTITSKSDSRDQLTLSQYTQNTVKVIDNAYLLTAKTDEERAAATTTVTFATDANTNFSTDSKIYIGTTDTAAVKVDKADVGDENTTFGIDLRGDGAAFENRLYDVKSFDASSSVAKYIMIGSGESTLKGGHTANAYWGGSSESQTFVGNGDATDYYWFGAGDGNDKVEHAGSEDVVYLWTTTSISDIKIATVGDTANVIYANDNSLTIEDGVAALKGGLTFMTQDGKSYTYDVNKQDFVQKAQA